MSLKCNLRPSIAGKQYKKLDKGYELDKINKKEKPSVKKYNRSNLICYNKYSSYEYYKIMHLDSFPLELKYPILASFYNELSKSNSLKLRKRHTKEKKVTAYDNASGLYNEFLEIYFDECKVLPDAKKRKLGNNYDPSNLFLERCHYDIWFENEELTDTQKGGEKESADLSSMLPLENDEE